MTGVKDKNIMRLEARAIVDPTGRILIPSSFRKALRIKHGDTLVLRVVDHELRVTTAQQQILRAQAVVRKHVKPGTSLVDELIAERRQAARRE